MDAVQTRGGEGKMERSEEGRREQGTRRAWIGILRANQNRGTESLIWSRQVWELGGGPACQAEGLGVTWQVREQEDPRVRLRGQGSPVSSGTWDGEDPHVRLRSRGVTWQGVKSY